MDTSYHIPVLVEPVLRYLLHTPDGIYVDGTLGGGGHAEAILAHLSDRGRLIGFDADADAISFSGKRLNQYGIQFQYIHNNFANIKEALHANGIEKIDGLLLDLGISSHQVDEEPRGFSYKGDAKIDMRMDQNRTLDGWTVVNQYTQDKLSELFWKFGEERNSRKIAGRIAHARIRNPINTTGELASVVQSVVGKQYITNTLARVFQAIRIEVNQELANLEKALRDALSILNGDGRIVVISYHSLEDRIVKSFFRNEAAQSKQSGNKYLPDIPCQPRLRLLVKKPVVPTGEEISQNSRARSAKLRAAERIDG
jgi:16S rRNA (cytosine1402-N4)-methyltransferase